MYQAEAYERDVDIISLRDSPLISRTFTMTLLFTLSNVIDTTPSMPRMVRWMFSHTTGSSIPMIYTLEINTRTYIVAVILVFGSLLIVQVDRNATHRLLVQTHFKVLFHVCEDFRHIVLLLLTTTMLQTCLSVINSRKYHQSRC